MTTEPERVWVEEGDDWRCVGAGVVKKCRYPRCPVRAVAELLRERKLSREPRHWWAYCAQHLYGRIVRDGKVLCAVHPESPMADRARSKGEVPT